jgi:hypothetical protein
LRECAINFWVECGSAGSYQGNDGVNRHNLRGVGGGGWGGDKRKVNINDNMDVSSCFAGALRSSNLVSVQATPVLHGFHDGGFYIKYIKRDERFNWIRIRFD